MPWHFSFSKYNLRRREYKKDLLLDGFDLDSKGLCKLYDQIAASFRLLLVTDRNLYLITQTIEDGQIGSSSEEIQVDYHTHVVMPIPSIEYFEVCFSHLKVTVLDHVRAYGSH